MSRKYTPPFATLVKSAGGGGGGGLYSDATFSVTITASLNREMFSGSVDAGFVLAPPFHHGDLEPNV